MTTTNPTYGDPGIVGSWLRGIIPTIVDSSSSAEKNRNRVFIMGRSKVTANTVNNLQPPLVPSAPFAVNNKMLDDQYIYFHLVFAPMAANNTPPSTNVIPGPSRLAFISLQNTGENFTPIPFILNTSGNPVNPGSIQPFTLSPVGLSNPNPIPNLSYIAQQNPAVYNTSAYEVSTQPKANIYLAPQGTETIPIYKYNSEDGTLNTPIDSSPVNIPNLESQYAYLGVWYKTFGNASAAEAALPNTSNLWHVFNPFKNAVDSELNYNIVNSAQFQLSPYTGGGEVLPVYTVGDPAPPINYTQSPTASLIVNNNQPPYTLSQLTQMVADMNDVGNVMSNWGLGEMEIMFIPYEASIIFSGGTSPAFGCYVSFPENSIAQFQSFTTTAYNQVLSYIDPNTGESITTRGCTNNTANGWLNTQLIGTTPPVYEFNNCSFSESQQCNTSNTGANGFWYQYCTGNEICGTNNCFGSCPNSSNGNFVPCVRDYAYTQSNTNGTTFWSCNPKQPRPNNPSNVNVWLIVLLVVVIIFIILLIFVMIRYYSSSDEEVVVTTVQPQPNQYYYG
jgi:hypothetical protein